MPGSDATTSLRRVLRDHRRGRALHRPAQDAGGEVSVAAASLPVAELALEGVNKSFPGVHALKDVSIEARRGDLIGLIGENADPPAVRPVRRRC